MLRRLSYCLQLLHCRRKVPAVRTPCRNSIMLSVYEDLLCRNVTQWFESHDVVTVSCCCLRCRRVLLALFDCVQEHARSLAGSI
jgi:hypothetical protein